MDEKFVAESSTSVDASAERVWSVITNPSLGELVMGATIRTDWKVGSPITWSGEYKGRQFVDKGEIVESEPGRKLAYTHFSPMSGSPDKPENYHTLTWTLDGDNPTTVSLSQDNNASEEEAVESKKMWDALVQGVKERAEG